ncbi:ATP-dependent protease, partial [Salmonella enterica subsp. enterica serovar Manhattan]|nr:ATP-dependent protease [Salmonella enterica subsp. enterica serovar Manhattan]
RVGNARYQSASDLPAAVPVFPLAGALLLPSGRLPLNIFEPRYLAMADAAMGGDRVIGMIQPALDGALRADGEPQLSNVGCLGRITSFNETGDGRYMIALDGICRFRIGSEMSVRTPYRQCRILPFLSDLEVDQTADQVDRKALLQALRDYVSVNGLEVDWDNISRAGNAMLVNALSMMAPYGPAEKQALLEAVDLPARAAMLVALTEIELARDSDGASPNLQ